MKKIKSLMVAGGLIACLPVILNAQELMIYPAKGQSDQQQEKDKFECYGFAKKQSGFDPMALPTTAQRHHPKKRSREVSAAVQWRWSGWCVDWCDRR